MESLAKVGLEVLIRRLFAETAEGLGKMAVEDDERVPRVGMTLKAFRQEHVSAEMHGPSPELGEQLALDSLVLDVPGRLGLRDRRNHLVEANDDGRDGSRARLDRHFLRRAVEIAGSLVPLLAFAAIHGELERVAVAAVKRLVKMNQCLNAVMPGAEADAGFRAGNPAPTNRRRPPASGAKIVHIEAEDLLGLGAVIDLEPRLVLGIGGEHDEQPTVERRFADLALEADANLDARVFVKDPRARCARLVWKATQASARARITGLMANAAAADSRLDEKFARRSIIIWSFQLMDIIQNSRWDADGQHGQLADGFVPRSPGHVDDDAGVQLDDFVVEHHRASTVDDVIEFVGSLVVVELGVVDLDVVDLGGRPVLFFDQRPDLAAGLFPGGDFGRVTAQELGGDVHGREFSRV